MDNPLTPKKIQRLIHLAEDNSFDERRLLRAEDLNLIISSQMHAPRNKSYVPGESSSGILDLDRIKAFGESDVGILSLESTAFIPGELSGRSTGAEEPLPARAEPHGCHSAMLDNLTKQMNKQTAEVYDIMRHSIATNFSFHSKRDLTADEMSLIAKEAPISVQKSYVSISENEINTDLSVGAYFKNRCPDFGGLLGTTESPDRSNLMPSITEVSSSTKFDVCKETYQLFAVDDTLDSVPVRQPRSQNTQKIPEPKKIQKVPEPVNKVLNKPEIPRQGCSAMPEKKVDATTSRIPTKSVHLNPPMAAHKSFMTSSKPADILLKNLHSSVRVVTEDTEGSVENSFSLSKIADYLGKQSNVSVTDMFQLQKKSKKQPLTELHLNTQVNEPEVQVTTLKDSKKTESASSAGTINTVIHIDPVDKLNLTKNVPEVIVMRASGDIIEEQYIETPKRTTRSKSTSSNSQTTLSTVRDNVSNLKVGLSPDRNSPGEANLNRSKVPSPNVEYKELDMSVDWKELLQQKSAKLQSLAKEKWADIETASVDGFVGVTTIIKIAVTTLTDNWITGKFEFNNLPNNGKDLTYELPRLPLLLSPRKKEFFIIPLTSSAEMRAILPYTICLKDTALDSEVTQKGTIQVNFKLPALRTISLDGGEKVAFPMSYEKAQLCKSFILASDCPADLQLQLSVTEGVGMFSIKSVQEIKKADINKVLSEKQAMADDQNASKKSKALNKQMCRLANGNAIKVTILFNAPSLSDSQTDETTASLSGVLHVNLFGVERVLTRVHLVASVGRANLVVNASAGKLCLTNEAILVDVINMGSLPGSWLAKMKVNCSAKTFKVNPCKFELMPGGTHGITMSYAGSEDIEGTILFEETASGARTYIEVVGIAEKNTSFPIKTNHISMSWVRPGRKEISFQNIVDKKIQIRCHIIGDGFSLDLPGGESKGVILQFSQSERRQLPIVFSPNTSQPCIAVLQLTYDKTSDATRKIRLYGCASGECVRWSGLVTYGDTALVRASYRAPVELKLYNKANSPAFIFTSVHFNLQYQSCEPSAHLVGGQRIIPPRSHHRVLLRVDWQRVERRARAGASTTLGSLTVLAGAEYTRRRLLRIIKDNGVPDTTLLPEHLKVLTNQFEGENHAIDDQLKDFDESKASLNELISSGLQELTAQIELPQDFADENSTIIIGDDTMIDHKTICE